MFPVVGRLRPADDTDAFDAALVEPELDAIAGSAGRPV
jgi:hypothetical protein